MPDEIVRGFAFDNMEALAKQIIKLEIKIKVCIKKI